MIDWLSSKIAMSVAALLLLTSAGGAFEIIRAGNAGVRLEDCADAVAGILWNLNSSAPGAEVAVRRGDSSYPHEVLGEALVFEIFDGLVVARAGGQSASARAPGISSASGAPMPWTGESLDFSKGEKGILVQA